ncbi:MAG: FAD-dependent thymidylate synthase [archaeon]
MPQRKPRANLIDFTPHPEKNVAVAARLCYSDKSPEELRSFISKREIEKLVRKVIDMGHTSTLEHTWFYFSIVCSRVCSHQLVRQRVGVGYSQRSQRYVTEDNFDYIIPPTIEKDENLKKMYTSWMKEAKGRYMSMLEAGVPKEDARFLLPQIKTNLVVSYNARSLRHFFKLRCCNRAQWEIRDIANQMLAQAKEVAPILFENAGPECVRGECPEGKLSCGKPWR